MAEFKSLIDKMNKQKEYKEDLIIEEEVVIETDTIPWVNAPRLQGSISVSWESSEIVNLQSQIDSLDSRVDALENP